MTLEQILEKDGRLVYRTRGTSMRPMLKQDRDLVIVEPAAGRLKKYDVALYRKGGNYILHRVIRVRGGDYLIRGDNTYVTEEGITDRDILGVLTSFSRRGRTFSAADRRYRLYARLWCALYPVRCCAVRLRRAAGRLRRSVGRRAAGRKE